LRQAKRYSPTKMCFADSARQQRMTYQLMRLVISEHRRKPPRESSHCSGGIPSPCKDFSPDQPRADSRVVRRAVKRTLAHCPVTSLTRRRTAIDTPRRCARKIASRVIPLFRPLATRRLGQRVAKDPPSAGLFFCGHADAQPHGRRQRPYSPWRTGTPLRLRGCSSTPANALRRSHMQFHMQSGTRGGIHERIKAELVDLALQQRIEPRLR
jgi:hypothetical protein